MAQPRFPVRLALTAVATFPLHPPLTATPPQDVVAPNESPESMRIELRPTQGEAERPICVASVMWPTVELARRGEIVLEENDEQPESRVDIYLPKLRRFPLINPGASNSSFDNKAAFFYIDQDLDGKLTADEAWFCNLPFRVDDRMLDVTGIAEDGAWLEIRASRAPLSGAVRGRALPTLTFQTMSGKEVVAPRDSLGKHLVIQVWSPT